MSERCHRTVRPLRVAHHMPPVADATVASRNHRTYISAVITPLPPAEHRTSSMRAPRPGRVGATWLSFLLMSCGGASDQQTVPPLTSDNYPTDLRAVSDLAVTGDARQPLTDLVVVVVRNGAGGPIQGTTVTFVVTSGGGSVSSTQRTTGADGKAFVTWTLGSASKTQTLSATVPELTPVVFTATVRPGAVSTLVKLSDESAHPVVNTIIAQSFAVRALDAVGNLVKGASVTAAITVGAGDISQTNAVTNDSGVATFSGWRVGTTVGRNSLEIRSGSATSVVYSIFTVPDAAKHVRLDSPDTLILAPGDIVPLPVTVSDQYGNAALPSSLSSLSYSLYDARVAEFIGGNLLALSIRGVGGGTTRLNVGIDVDSLVRGVTVLGHPTIRLGETFGPPASGYEMSIANGKLVGGGGTTIWSATTHTFQSDTGVAVVNIGVTDVGMLNDGVSAVAICPDSSLKRFDMTRHVVTASMPLGDAPTRLLLSPDATRAFVLANRSLLSVNLKTSTVDYSTKFASSVQWMVSDTRTGVLYVASSGGATYAVSAASGQITSTFTLRPTNGIAVSRDGRFLYNLVSGTPSVVDVVSVDTKQNVGSLTLSGTSNRMIRSADGLMLYVTTSQPNQLNMLDVTTTGSPTPAGIQQLPIQPVTMAMDPRGATLVVGLSGRLVWFTLPARDALPSVKRVHR